MRIAGLQKLTLLDYPGITACTVFTAGCNFCCPFCQNGSLVRPGEAEEACTGDELLAFLKKRAGLLDGVCFSGGEPLLQPDLAEWMARAKALGYRVKLDTNGSFPGRLRALVERGLVDYVAMDVKNSPEKYAETAGLRLLDLAAVRESAAYLLSRPVEYEFRTTVVREFHEREDFLAIGRWIRGAERYFLQGFVDSGDLLRSGLHACTPEEMRGFLAAAREGIPAAQLRGIE